VGLLISRELGYVEPEKPRTVLTKPAAMAEARPLGRAAWR